METKFALKTLVFAEIRGGLAIIRDGWRLRALSFCQNWPARPFSLQRKCNNLKEHLDDSPSYSSGGVYIILKVS